MPNNRNRNRNRNRNKRNNNNKNPTTTETITKQSQQQENKDRVEANEPIESQEHSEQSEVTEITEVQDNEEAPAPTTIGGVEEVQQSKESEPIKVELTNQQAPSPATVSYVQENAISGNDSNEPEPHNDAQHEHEHQPLGGVASTHNNCNEHNQEIGESSTVGASVLGNAEMGGKQSKQEPIAEKAAEQPPTQPHTPTIIATATKRQAKVIVHRIVRENEGKEESKATNIVQPLSLPSEPQKVATPERKSPSPVLNRPSTIPKQSHSSSGSKVIIHQIHIEAEEPQPRPHIEVVNTTTPAPSETGTLSPPPRYLVQSPSPSKVAVAGSEFARFARDVQISELNSDCSSGEFNAELQSPLVCEVESEPEPSTPEPGQGPLSLGGNRLQQQQEELRLRRAQKRNALESHFLPQLLSPRYLDSILEENSDAGSEHALSRTCSSSSANDPTSAAATGHRQLAKANHEAFPKSHLDFTRSHRRNAPENVALKLEARLLEQPDAEQGCTRLESTLSPQSEAAELVYLSSSASSSVSDLVEMELELEQAAALAERALVDLDTDANTLIVRPGPQLSESSGSISTSERETETETEVEADSESRESTPVNHAKASSTLSLSSQTTPTPTATPTPASTATATEEATATAAATLTTANDRVLFGEEAPSFGSSAAPDGGEATVPVTRGIESESESATNSQSDVNRSCEPPAMDKVRELVEQLRDNVDDDGRAPPVPPPPSRLAYDPDPVPGPAITPTPPAILTVDALTLKRQDSCDSHCSDSTQHSQCTAIQMNGSFPCSPTALSPTPTSTPTPTSAPPAPPTRHKYNQNIVHKTSDSLEHTEDALQSSMASASTLSAADEAEASSAIKKLRLLCTETLASMPYGDQVLEELANIAQDIGEAHGKDMPYPLPELPHISELQLQLADNSKTPLTASTDKSAWLGMQTSSEPKVLVCLSPGQRALIDTKQSSLTGNQSADELLDAHQKFVERRGYHELSAAEVSAIDSEREQEHQILQTAAMMKQLRKSLTPTPPPVPPPPVPVKSSTTAAKAMPKSDVNTQPHDANAPKESTIRKDNEIDERQNRLYEFLHSNGKTTHAVNASSHENNSRRTADNGDARPVLEQRQRQQQQSSAIEEEQKQQRHCQSQSSSYMTTTTRSTNDGKFPSMPAMESDLERMFPRMAGHQGPDIFDEQRKRFSNIEVDSPRISTPQSKRYSNIETSTYNTSKRVENGQVIYDTSTSSHERQHQGDDELDCAPPAPPPPVPPPPQMPEEDKHRIMSSSKLNNATTTTTSTKTTTEKTEKSSTTSSSSLIDDAHKNSHSNGNANNTNNNGNSESRTKVVVEEGKKTEPVQGNNHFDHDKLFKDFDTLSQQLHAELQSGRAAREQRDKSASLFDLSRLSSSGKQQFDRLKQERHAHMQELEKEIERSSIARQQRMSVPRFNDDNSSPQAHEIPVQIEREPLRYRRAESMCNLPEEQAPRPHTSAGHYYGQQDDWAHYASDLGYSENIAKPFAREVEICYQRQQPRYQHHTIRAPRLSASTNDLSAPSHHSFDPLNVYAGRRTHAPMVNQAPQRPQRSHYTSCYSMIERDPNPTYISTTSRRGVSPAPQPPTTVPVLEPERQRRSSLPRELHEQQLKYIQSQEEALKSQFERLQQERHRLMEEIHRAPAPPQRRENFRPTSKLPTLTEDEVFRQQMAEEWLNKVAEREERRLHKIVKISKLHDAEEQHAGATISDEFLDRVKQRRNKLSMPADSDWESGAESQPQASRGHRQGQGHGQGQDNVQSQASGESDADVTNVRFIEGQSEANLRHLPHHLREFAKFSNHETEQIPGGQSEVHQEEERRTEQLSDNALSSASKKSTIVKTYKVSRLPPSVQHQASAISQCPEPQGASTATATSTAPASATTMKMPRQTAHLPPTVRMRQRPHNGGSSSAAAVSKQTRFLLSAQQLQKQRQRRSWSESDLLKEIDEELQLAKGFLFADGVWTPKSQTPHGSTQDLNATRAASTPPPPPLPPSHPVWTPQPSPTCGRKEFRPVHFESPTLPRRYTALHQSQQQQSTPWCMNSSTPTLCSDSTDTTDCPLQISQAPLAVTSSGSSVTDKIKTFERSASNSELHRPFIRRQQSADHRRPAAYRPNEVIYRVKHEYMSEPETESDRPRKMAQLGRRQYDGIGPVTNDGMPIILRSEVQEPHQHEWYKRLYQTIHKQKNGDEFVIRYKCPRARPTFKSGGYMSEPEPNYDSDYSTVKYRTHNPHRVQSVSSAVNVRNLNQDESFYGTMPNPIKSAQHAYKNQPGRIENYTTGHSSVSEKEKKEWWDEVMDIFNGWLRQHTRIPRIIIEFVDDFDVNGNLEQSKLSPNYTEGNLSRALAKESGYTSDSNLVFRKRELPVSSPLSPVEQREAYKSLQAGGEPPLLGFRKPAPEKQKEFVEEFEFIQISPTLTKIRVSTKELESDPEEENVVESKPSPPTPPPPPPPPTTAKNNMFSHFSKNLPSFIPLSSKKHQQQETEPPAPKPPHRKSSCTKSTVRVTSTRHEQCFQPPVDVPLGANKYGTITLRKHTSSASRREPICRSKSTGAVSTLLATLSASKETRNKDGNLTRVQQHHARLRSVSPTRRLLALRQSSRSPVAFGRSISKERSFAEEKKRLENTLPPCRTNFEASTNILRDPSLKSPQEVKQAVRSYATCNAHTRSKSLPRLRSSVRPATSTVSTTTRHTMCFPQVRPQGLLDCTRALKKAVKGPPKIVKAVHVHKSNSIESLPRSNSTYSIDSVPIAPPKTYVSKPKIIKPIKASGKPQVAAPLQNSKSDTHIARKRAAQRAGKQASVAVAVTNPPKTYHSQVVSLPQQEIYSESVREKTNFWNDYNAKQCHSLTTHTAAPVQTTDFKYCSLSPSRHEMAVQYIDDLYSYEAEPEQANHIDDLVWKYENNQGGGGSSGGAGKSGDVTDIARPQSPHQSQETCRRFSPTREIRVPQTPRHVRSPSRRRIDSLRSSSKQDQQANKIIRASSLSSADDRSKRGLYLCGELAHSATSLNCLDRHSPTCRYRNNCERFTELNRFYSTLERVGQLERATSSSNFHPLRKDAELLDFEEWRKVRLHERAEKELQYLMGKLKHDQREKDLHYRSKHVEDIKWRHETDHGLHSKEKSVEDLRENFEQINLLKQQDSPRPRTYWRRNTVADLANTLEQKFSGIAAVESVPPETERHLGNDLVSTLSKDQIKKISQQLTEIYAGNRGSAKPLTVSEQYVVTVDHGSKPSSHASTLKVRCNSSITKDDMLGPVLRKREAREDSQTLPRATRGSSPVIVARETRGAIAAKNAELTLTKPPELPPRPKSNEPVAPALSVAKPKQLPVATATSDANSENISHKIQYFEERQFDEPPKTIYHAREDSSPDESEVMRLIEQNMQSRAQHSHQLIRHSELSNSLTDINGVFGERQATTRVNFHLHTPPLRPPDDGGDIEEQTLLSYELEQEQMHSPDGSLELYNSYYRSRSLSPQSQASSCCSHLQRVHTGDVQKIKQQFENYHHQHQQSQQREQSNERRDFFGLSSLRKARSDPEFNINLETGSKDALGNASDALQSEQIESTVATTTTSPVTWLTHKFEVRNTSPDRGRRRQRGAISPGVPRDRHMPHIDIISKTAALKRDIIAKKPPAVSPTRSHSSNSVTGGIVGRLRSRYESPEPTATVRYLSTSHPDLRDVHDISPHLSSDWVAHKHPKQEQRVPRKPQRQLRANSTSPPRPPKSQRHQATTQMTNALRPRYGGGDGEGDGNIDIFANQKFDPNIHRPKARYVPDGAENRPSTSLGSGGSTIERYKKTMAVTFKDLDSSAPPIPPQLPAKGFAYDQYNNGSGSESPNRYYETDVNIHFKTPVRQEYKQPLSEDELAIRQADHMRKLYQEERRRKYLQELQDMNSRRHTDNFTPSQKSPIALNRYDDFPTDVALKSLIGPKTVARALYNFQGQTSKELSFRKGETIYIRRQIDGNWYEGEHNAMIGLLPVNYVEIISREGGARTPSKRPSEGQARAKYNFQAQSGVELSLNKGELVTLTRRVDGNWFEGKIANRKGIFPVSYVEILTDIGAEDIAAKTTTTVISSHHTTNLRPALDVLRTNINNEFNTLTQNGSQPPNGILKDTKQQLHKTDALHVDTSSEPLAYRALYKYRPQNSDELELLEGDLVHVLEKCDDGWFVGTSQRTGCFGTFPGNYVERA